ncbi:uncharacterized protein LOC143029485 [Oratosquilla oratoria]|uniref:uncharacterized protein LOC143029485 n=1 Tax=Oratosquilla oratoria TaxID=337810 RepID=UPI003F7683C3
MWTMRIDAAFQLPLVLRPSRLAPWERLYHTPTISANLRSCRPWTANAPGYSDASSKNSEFSRNSSAGSRRLDEGKDSLDWTLSSEYDHARSLFALKQEVFRRNRSNQLCDRSRSVLTSAGPIRITRTGDIIMNKDDDLPDSEVNEALHRSKDSLLAVTNYSPRPLHMLHVPKGRHGYSRNPTGTYFTS